MTTRTTLRLHLAPNDAPTLSDALLTAQRDRALHDASEWQRLADSRLRDLNTATAERDAERATSQMYAERLHEAIQQRNYLAEQVSVQTRKRKGWHPWK